MMQKLLVGSIGAIAISFGLLFAFNHNKPYKIINRQIVLEIIKKIRQEMYVVLFDISSFVQQNSSQIPPNQLRSLILSEDNPNQLSKAMKEKLKDIYIEYQTTQDQFEKNIKQVYKNDVEIQYYLKQYQEEVQKALLGSQPEFKQDFITFMGKNKLIELIKQLLTNKITRVTEKLKSIKSNIEKQEANSTQNQKIKKILKEDQKQNRTYRLKLLRQLGLVVSQEKQLIRIFQFCVGKYLRFDQKFKQEYQRINKEYHSEIKNLIQKFMINKIEDLDQ